MPTNSPSDYRRRGIRLWRKNKSFIYNLHPPRIPAAGARWTYTFGLGGLAVLAAAITLITGLLLMFYYVPTVDQAHTSLSYINSVVTLGGFIRSLHFWAAQMMVATVALHMVRIVFELYCLINEHLILYIRRAALNGRVNFQDLLL